tara:strand:- start:433 stop:696 length:264 start_codon:yes stop_codon:yes gene_type:complete
MIEGATADGGAVLILCVTFCVADDVLVELLVFTFCELLTLVLLLVFCVFTVLELVDVFMFVLLFVDKFVLLDVEFTVLLFVLVTFCV